MALNVLFEGITLAVGATVVPGELGLFLALGAPMPVGTRLVLERPGRGRQRVRVNKVREGADPGVYIAAEGAIVFPLVEDPDLVPTPGRAPQRVDIEFTAPSPAPAQPRAAAPAAADSVSAAPPAGATIPSAPPFDMAENPFDDLAGEATVITRPAFEEPAAASHPGAATATTPGAAGDAAAAAGDSASDTDDDEPPAPTANGAEKPDAGDRGGRARRRNKRGGGRR